MRTGLVKVLVEGRLVTGLLGNKKPGGVYSIVAFVPETIRVESLEHRGKGAVGHGDFPNVVVGTLIPEAVVFEPGRITTHGVFFVDYDNDGAAEQMLAWYRQQGQQGGPAATGEGEPGESVVAADSNAGNAGNS